MSQLEIQILHQDYLLTCPDGREAQLLEAVERVDQQFQQMRDTSKLRSRERVGVLLAVNLAYENLELRNQLQALQQQLASGQAEAESAPSALDTAAMERLQVLQAQAAADQAAAQRLLARLDAALAQPAVMDDAADTKTTLTVDATPAEAPLTTEPAPATDCSDAAADTDLNNAPPMGLLSTTPESA